MGKSHRKDDIAAQIRRVERDGEAMVHRIAWSAVKRRYRKAGEDWVPVER